MSYTNWEVRFLRLAFEVATWSKDPSTSVGAVAVDSRRRVCATGYNGFPRGIADDGRLDDRPTKYKLVVHAEANAILNAVTSLEGTTLYCTHDPCTECAKLIIQAGIVEVLVPMYGGTVEAWRDDQHFAHEMFIEAGVKVRHIESL